MLLNLDFCILFYIPFFLDCAVATSIPVMDWNCALSHKADKPVNVKPEKK